MAKDFSRIERDIERLKEKISEYQQQLKELESAKTEQENLQIIQLVRSMNMTPDEFAAFPAQRCVECCTHHHPVPQTGGCRR